MVTCSTCTSVPFSLDLVLATFLLSESLVQKNGDVVVPSPFPGGGGVGWGTPLYKPYRYVRPHRVGFLSRFSLKTRIHFAILVYIKYQQVHSNKPINGAGSPNCRPGRWFSTIKLVEKYETANWSLRQGDEKVNKRIKQNIYTVFPRLIASIK